MNNFNQPSIWSNSRQGLQATSHKFKDSVLTNGCHRLGGKDIPVIWDIAFYYQFDVFSGLQPCYLNPNLIVV